MRTADTQELTTPEEVAAYWDNYLNEFGPEAYVEARYTSQLYRMSDDIDVVLLKAEKRRQQWTREAGRREQFATAEGFESPRPR